jgi:hypothetical protein
MTEKLAIAPVNITPDQLFMMCSLFMYTDGMNFAHIDPETYSQWLNEAAQALGWPTWIEAYHEIQPTKIVMVPDPDPAQPPPQKYAPAKQKT